MRAFWNAQLARIAQVGVPDTALVNAYKSGFITTQIIRSGNDLDSGVNGYESEYSHDVVGILTNLFTQGSFTDAHALLTEARNVVGAQGQYVDGLWTLSVPWAVYLLKTGTRHSSGRISPPGTRRGAEPRGRRTRHRGGPDGAAGDHGGHRRHRHRGLLDHRRLRGAPRAGRLPLPGDGPGRRRRGLLGVGAVRQPPRRDERRARSDHRQQPSRLPALLADRSPTRPTAATTRRTPTGPRPSRTGPGRAPSSAPP